MIFLLAKQNPKVKAMENNYPITIAYDMKKKRAGCALLQATYGGTIDSYRLGEFNDWLTHPTDDIQLYTLKTAEEFNKAVTLTNTTKNGN